MRWPARCRPFGAHGVGDGLLPGADAPGYSNFAPLGRKQSRLGPPCDVALGLRDATFREQTIQSRSQAPENDAILTQSDELESHVLPCPFGRSAESLALRDNLVIYGLEHALAPFRVGIIPGIGEERPNKSSLGTVEIAFPDAAFDRGGNSAVEGTSLPEALKFGETLVTKGMSNSPDRLVLFNGSSSQKDFPDLVNLFV